MDSLDLAVNYYMQPNDTGGREINECIRNEAGNERSYKKEVRTSNFSIILRLKFRSNVVNEMMSFFMNN